MRVPLGITQKIPEPAKHGNPSAGAGFAYASILEGSVSISGSIITNSSSSGVNLKFLVALISPSNESTTAKSNKTGQHNCLPISFILK